MKILALSQKQYEAYLLRVYANRQPPSIAGDSGIASQHETKCPRKTVVVETKNVPPSQPHPTASPRSNQPQMPTLATKFNDQVPRDDISPINHPILPNASLDMARSDDYQQADVLRAPQIQTSINQSDDQFIHRALASSASDSRQYPQMTFGYGEDAFPSDLRNVSNLHLTAPVSSMMMTEQTPSDINPINRFFREHVESVQTAPGLSTIARSIDDATRHVNSESILRRFNLPFQYDSTNMLSDSQSRIKKYDTFDTAPLTKPNPASAKSSTYRLDLDAGVDQLGSLPGYMDYTLTSPRKSEDGGSIRSLTSDDVDNLIRRNECLLWRNADIAQTRRSPVVLNTNDADLDENGRTTAILESELDRYISNIRKLHREHGVQSLEDLDHEQNTSGDLLNVSLSEDALELSAEDKKDKKERIPEDMSKILALANDLISKTVNPQTVAPPVERIDNNVSSTEDAIRHRNPEEISMKNEIKKENVALRSMELEGSCEDSKIVKGKWDDGDDLTELRERDHETPGARKHDREEKVSSSNDKSRIEDDCANALREKQLDPVVGVELDIEKLSDVVEELAPWDLASVQKQVLELYLNDPDKNREKEATRTIDQSDDVANKPCDLLPGIIGQSMGDNKMEESIHSPRDMLPHLEKETKDLDASEFYEKNRTNARIEESGDAFEISSHRETNEPIKSDESINTSQIAKKLDESDKNDNKKQDSDETAEFPIDKQIMEQDDQYNIQQAYIQDPSQTQQYAQEGGNEQYNYEQNMTYGDESNQEYERYGDQGYAQQGQEYVEYVDSQYDQYPEDPNSQQYQQDPNVQYEQDPNQMYTYNYDPNQGYGNDLNQQYDTNQEYEGDPNQAYGYTEQVYDPNQTYDNNEYEQGYQEEQREELGISNAENQEERPEPQETLQSSQADFQSEHKSGEESDQLRQTDVVANDTNQSKQKKDVIKSLLDSDTDTTIERNVSNTESDFDFN